MTEREIYQNIAKLQGHGAGLGLRGFFPYHFDIKLDKSLSQQRTLSCNIEQLTGKIQLYEQETISH